MARTEKYCLSLSIYKSPLYVWHQLAAPFTIDFRSSGSFSSANKSLPSLNNYKFFVVFFFSCHPSLWASSVILVRSDGFLLIDTELRGSKTKAKSLKMSYLALNLLNLTVKRYNILHPSAFENLVIQISILGVFMRNIPQNIVASASFRSYPRVNENAEIYFGTQLPFRKA